MGNQHSDSARRGAGDSAAVAASAAAAGRSGLRRHSSSAAAAVASAAAASSASAGGGAAPAAADKPVLYNTPYLTVMFEKLAEESRAQDASLPPGIVSQAVFERVFSGPLNQLGKLLYHHIALGSSRSPEAAPPGQQQQQLRNGGITRDEFLRVATEILSLMLVSHQISYYFKIFSRSSPTGLSREDADLMILVCYTVSLACAYLPYDPTPANLKILKAFTTSLIVDDKPVDEEEFTTWCLKNCQNLFNGVHCFLLIRLSGSSVADLGWHQRVSQAAGGDGSAVDARTAPTVGSPPSDSALAAADTDVDGGGCGGPALLQAVRNRTSALELSLVWLLSCSLPARYLTAPPPVGIAGAGSGSTWGAGRSDWVPASATRGGAFVPSFLVSKLHQIIEHNPWTELYNSDRDGLSTNRFENHVMSYRGPTVTLITFGTNLYVIACDEEWRESAQRFGKEDALLIQLLPRFAIVKSGPGLFFMNHHNRGSPKGIFVGGKDGGKSLVLHIDEMTRVKHYGVDLPLQQVEVWGCASSEVREIQVRQRQWEHKEADKMSNRKLKLEAWEDNPDRQLLSWAGISTNHAEKT